MNDDRLYRALDSLLPHKMQLEKYLKERLGELFSLEYDAYVLWKMVGQMAKRSGLGDEPRKVFDEIAQIKVVDVVMPTKQGPVIRKRCLAQPTKAQAILLQKLRLHLPQRMKIHEM